MPSNGTQARDPPLTGIAYVTTNMRLPPLGSAFGPFALSSSPAPHSGQPNGRIDVQRRGHLIG